MTTTAPADAREVLLATIRGRLLDDDAHMLRLGEDDNDRHTTSIAEQALDAALARGIALSDVYAVAATELAGMGLGDGPIGSIFDPNLDQFEDVLVEEWAPDAPAVVQGRTVREIRRTTAVNTLYVLTAEIQVRAVMRLSDATRVRIREAGLPRNTTVGEVMNEPERIAIWTAGLYGDPEEPAVGSTP